ncbi:MAG: threonine--tRNA ligase [Candidatus Pacebacteria bacterium]|nr:threonine--tRNA ligase [Candidatus Paceibacterota bacterium]
MNESLAHKRHTLAHLLAAAMEKFHPNAKPTLGPAIDNGFYYDFDLSDALVKPDPTQFPDFLKALEAKMKELLPSWTEFSHEEVSREVALERFSDNQYKKELIEEIAAKGETLTLYTCGGFTDLCRGGHVDHPAKDIPADSFKLSHTAGAYWRGSEKNPMLTRIYGLAFASKAELEAYELQQEEAKKRDHRELGERLDLFTFDESIGKGLPIWLPKGNVIKEELEKWAKETEEKWDYQRVTTPIITKEDLFYTSGHLPLYKDSMYAPIKIEEENYYIKPMNCPFHHKTFAARPKSYRDLPVRFAEYGWCHRYEDSGSLFGLMRVRGMQMNDAHIYVQKEKAVEEFLNVIKLHEYYYKMLGINDYEMVLALRDPNKMDKYHGDEEDWKDAERMTIEAMEQSGVRYKIVNEGAAFYGPKMDFEIYSSIGRSFTASTNQLDLFMGKRFGLKYTDSDGQSKVPAIIHRAPLGTHERFIGFLIEHFAGAFPTWLSPVQVSLIPVSDKHLNHAQSILAQLKEAGIRTELDDSNETLGKKIRAWKLSKNPYALVLGEKEAESGVLTIETRSGEKHPLSLEDLIARLKKEIAERS